MFEIPENLPLSLSPLAWMIGRWQGWGVLTGESDKALVQEIRTDIVGEHMRMVTTLYFGEATADVPAELSAKDGLDIIKPGELFREETSYWRVATPLAAVPSEDESPKELALTSSGTDGFSVLWVGAALGPRITLATDVIARQSGAPEVDRMTRMYGLVAGELMWTTDRTIQGGEPEIELTGRLMRVTN
jgi:Domain of unknown function (DUF1794).